MFRLIPLALLVLAIFPKMAEAQEPTTIVTVDSPYTSVAIDAPKSSAYDLDLTIRNSGDEATVVNIRFLSRPDNWDASVYSRFKQFEVRRVELPPGGETGDLTFHFVVPQNAEDGAYTFRVGLFDEGDSLFDDIEYRVEIGKPSAQEEGPGQREVIRLEPRYTGLTGPKGSSFKFTVELRNTSGQDRQFDLNAQAPQGWQVSFAPSFQQDTQIASLSLKAGDERLLEVTVKPPGNAESGLYTILLMATTEDIDPAVAPVEVQLTGTPDLVLSTLTGRLNAEATAGEESDIKLVLANSGTAGLDNVQLFSNAPESWKVSFDQSVVRRLEPTELVEITASVTPPGRTIPGDYSIGIIAAAPEAQTVAEIRITVGRSTAFGWVGILVVVLVVVGIGALFVRLGRR